MKHFLFALLFGPMVSHGQTVGEMRAMIAGQINDTVKVIPRLGRSNDTVGVYQINSSGTVISPLTWRFSISDKVDTTRFKADSVLTRAAIPTNTNQLTNGAAFITRTGISAGTGIAYNNSTGVITTDPAGPSISTPSRSLNSNFTVSSTRPAFVSYSDSCVVTNPLLAGNSSADIWLEYSTNAGSTWVQVATNGNRSAVALTVTVAITNSQKGTLAGYIPANALVRLRSTTSGTASVTIVNQQETIL